MTHDPLVFLDANDGTLCEEAYDRVFRPGFDTTELPDISGVRPVPGRSVLVALDESGVVAGGVSDSFPGSGVGLLSYLATRSDARGRGWGARVLERLRARWRDEELTLVLGEVRDPRAWSTSETERPVDRLRFYARHGCHLLPVPWVQPAIGGAQREGGLLLISVHGTTTGSTVEATQLSTWAARYYREAEGGEPTDAQYVALIERLSARDLEVARIEDYERVDPLGWDTGSTGPAL